MLLLDPTQLIEDVRTPLAGLPACIAGSSVAAQTYGLDLQDTSDIDVFNYSKEALIAGTQRLLHAGFTVDERHERVWSRWLRWGIGNWHTVSLRLKHPAGYETNMVYKTMGGKPLTSLAEVLESFDFGLLGVGYDLYDGNRRDLRGYLFPKHDPKGPLPLMPNKRDDWLQGFISWYNALREPGRYAKYQVYGHDMRAVKDDLLTGYQQAINFQYHRGFDENLQKAEILEAIHRHIDGDHIDELMAAAKEIPQLDTLDAVLDALQ